MVGVGLNSYLFTPNNHYLCNLHVWVMSCNREGWFRTYFIFILILMGQIKTVTSYTYCGPYLIKYHRRTI